MCGRENGEVPDGAASCMIIIVSVSMTSNPCARKERTRESACQSDEGGSMYAQYGNVPFATSSVVRASAAIHLDLIQHTSLH